GRTLPGCRCRRARGAVRGQAVAARGDCSGGAARGGVHAQVGRSMTHGVRPMHFAASFRGLALAACLAPIALAESKRPELSAAVRRFVAVVNTIVLLRHARVVDGTSSPARSVKTLVIRDGRIAAVGPDGYEQIPAGEQYLALSGQTVF